MNSPTWACQVEGILSWTLNLKITPGRDSRPELKEFLPRMMLHTAMRTTFFSSCTARGLSMWEKCCITLPSIPLTLHRIYGISLILNGAYDERDGPRHKDEMEKWSRCVHSQTFFRVLRNKETCKNEKNNCIRGHAFKSVAWFWRLWGERMLPLGTPLLKFRAHCKQQVDNFCFKTTWSFYLPRNLNEGGYKNRLELLHSTDIKIQFLKSI